VPGSLLPDDGARRQAALGRADRDDAQVSSRRSSIDDGCQRSELLGGIREDRRQVQEERPGVPAENATKALDAALEVGSISGLQRIVMVENRFVGREAADVAVVEMLASLWAIGQEWRVRDKLRRIEQRREVVG
jgi:hypothetical protein